MFGWSPITIIIILVVVFLIFGAGKLPEIGSGFGKALKNFKNSVSGKDEIDVTPEEDEKPAKSKRKSLTRTKTVSSSSAARKEQTGSKSVRTSKKA